MKGGESSMEQTEILLAIQQQLTMLQSTIDTLREQSRQKDEEIERLRQIILNLQRAQFGQRSEKRTYVLDDGNQQLSMFDTPKKSEETPVPEPSQNPEKEIRVSGHSRKKKRTLEELCASLPVEERIVDLPDDEKANVNGHALVCIGQEYIRTELVLERAKAKVVKGWLFADTPQGAEASAIIYSLMETAKANNLRLDDYLLHLLSILPERAEQSKDFEIEDLLPWSEEMKSWFSAV